MEKLIKFETKADFESAWEGMEYPLVALSEETVYVKENAPTVELIKVGVVSLNSWVCLDLETNVVLFYVTGEKGMTWREWLGSEYCYDEDGGKFEEGTDTWINYRTPDGYYECGFSIDSLDSKMEDYPYPN
jgi:hypothetical protein